MDTWMWFILFVPNTMRNLGMFFQTACSLWGWYASQWHWGKTAIPLLKPMALSGLFKTCEGGDQEQRKDIRCKWRQNLDEDLLTFFFLVWISFYNFLLTVPFSVLLSLLSGVWSSFQARVFSASFNPFDCTHIQINLNYCYFFFSRKVTHSQSGVSRTKVKPAARRLFILLAVCIWNLTEKENYFLHNASGNNW